MRLTLGSVNLALMSIYFIPFWGRDAIRALISPYKPPSLQPVDAMARVPEAPAQCLSSRRPHR